MNCVAFHLRLKATLREAYRHALSARPTYALVVGVQQLHQRSRRSLAVDNLSWLLVQGQLTQNARRHTLHVVHWRVKELERKRKTFSWKTYIEKGHNQDKEVWAL